MKNKFYIFAVVVILLTSVASSVLTWQLTKPDPVLEHTKEDLMAEFYKTENAVSVSPHTLRQEMDKGSTSFIVVDLRSPGEYKAEHITGAVNIFGGQADTAKMVEQFKALPQNKVIVTYCYSAYCMLSRKVGNILAENGMYVKHLNIGWNEWRYDWQAWNSPSEWETTKPEDYVTIGDAAGTPIKRTENFSSCNAENAELGC